MADSSVGGPVINAETGAPAGATYILHQRRSFGARIVTFFSRVFVISFIAVAGFGSGYVFKEREGFHAERDLRQTIANLEKEILQAETTRLVRDAGSTTIEVDLTSVLDELRGELTKVAEARVASASGELTTAMTRLSESSFPEAPVAIGRPLGFDLQGLPTTRGSVPPMDDRQSDAPPVVGELVAPRYRGRSDDGLAILPRVTELLSIPQQAENSLPLR